MRNDNGHSCTVVQLTMASKQESQPTHTLHSTAVAGTRTFLPWLFGIFNCQCWGGHSGTN